MGDGTAKRRAAKLRTGENAVLGGPGFRGTRGYERIKEVSRNRRYLEP